MPDAPNADLSAKRIQSDISGDREDSEREDSAAAESTDGVHPEQTQADADEPRGPGPKDPAMDAEAEAVLAERLRALGYMP